MIEGTGLDLIFLKTSNDSFAKDSPHFCINYV